MLSKVYLLLSPSKPQISLVLISLSTQAARSPKEDTEFLIWLGLWFLGEHPAAQDATLLLSPHHTPGDSSPGALATCPPSNFLFAPCLQLPPKGTWELQELLPRAPSCTKHFICCASRCGSGPWGHPALPCVLPWDKAARRRRQGREKINKSIRLQQHYQKLFSSRFPLSQGSWG